MNRLIPEIKGHEKTTLYIIGNGFDMFHGLKTSYQDFRDWLIRSNCKYFVSDMEMMFPRLYGKELLLWRDFEEAMDSFDLIKIHKNFHQGPCDLYDEATFRMAVERIKLTLRKIPLFLRQWLSSIDIIEAKPQFDLDWNSRYFSFNYTMLLEHIYSIPGKRVMHIHNNLEGKEPLITGHKAIVSEYSTEYQCEDYIEEQSTMLIAQEMNQLVKPVDKLKKTHKVFFAALKDISNVVVFGHSLGNIDKPYIVEIQKNIKDYAHWYFITKDDSGVATLKKYVKQYNDYYDKKFVYGAELFCKKMLEENCKYFKTEK